MKPNKSFLKERFNDKDYYDYEKMNEIAYMTILNRYRLKAINVYKWKNLPKNIEPHIIEELLFNYGVVGFNYDEERGYLALQVNAWNYMDINYRPVQATLIGYGFFKNVNVYWGEDTLKTIIMNDKPYFDKNNTAIMIKNNDLYIPTYYLLMYKLYQLWNIERGIDSEVIQLGLQHLIVADTEDRENIRQLFNQLIKHKPFNAINTRGLKTPLNSLNLNHEFKGLELQEMKRNVESEISTMLGLNNINYEKKERLLTGEIESNNENIENELEMGLKTRKEACTLINNFFGLNINVEVNKVKETEDSKGGLDDEKNNI